MKNVFLLTCSSQSLTSVEVISKDIQSVYLDLQGPDCKIEVIDVNDKTSIDRDFSTFSDLIFISIHPGVIRSEALLKIAQKMRVNDKLIIHVYGDFLRQAPFFYETQRHLKNKNVLFLPPSKTYGGLLEKVILNPACIRPTPFPVETPPVAVKNPDAFKKKYQINDEIVLVYGGRISRQKNLDKLIEWFNALPSGEKYKLFIVGKFDDFEVATVGNNLKLGELYQKLQPQESSSIIFLDHLSHGELYEFFQFADYFVSFSTYHDEDFGRAPIEAVLNGSRAILTDWGGYRDLIQEFPEFVTGIEVSLDESGLEISPPAKLHLSKKESLLSSLPLKEKYALSTFKKTVSGFINHPLPIYSGVNEAFSELARDDKSFFYDSEGKLNRANYKRIYRGFGSKV